MRRRSCPLLAVALALAAAPARADVLPEGHESVTHRFVVEASDEVLGGRELLIFPAWPDEARAVEPGEPFTFYKVMAPHLYAVAERPTELEGVTAEQLEAAGAARAEEPFHAVSSVPWYEATREVVTTFRVDSIADGRIALTRVSERHLGADGGEVAPGALSSAAWGLGVLVALGAVVLGALVVVFLRRRRPAAGA